MHDGIAFRQCGIDRVEITDNAVHLDDGSVLAYDVLVVATGARLVPEETEGLTGPGWMDNVFTFYSLEGAAALAAALAAFDGGRLVVNVVDMPIKCPVAPARVLLPGRLVLPRARDPRPGRASRT